MWKAMTICICYCCITCYFRGNSALLCNKSGPITLSWCLLVSAFWWHLVFPHLLNSPSSVGVFPFSLTLFNSVKICSGQNLLLTYQPLEAARSIPCSSKDLITVVQRYLLVSLMELYLLSAHTSCADSVFRCCGAWGFTDPQGINIHFFTVSSLLIYSS